MTRFIIPQRISLRVSINGSQAFTSDQRLLRALKTTNTLLSGAADAEIDLFIPTGKRWPWGLRAMDKISIDAAVTSRPTPISPATWKRIFTGVLTDVPVAEATDAGMHVPLKAASMYHVLEVTTETDANFQNRYKQSGVNVGDFINQAMGYAGLPPAIVDTGAPDANSGLLPLGAIDPNGFQLNQQYQDWASVLASLAKMAGRELFADEDGNIRYRPSHYKNSSKGMIPSELLLNVQATLDTDAGIINRVQVRYTTQETTQRMATAPAVGTEIPGYDRPHYRDRLLIISAPWLWSLTDAEWLAQWVLSWAMSNTRPALVTMNFWPEVRVGEVRTLEWPMGTKTDYYVSSVVHQVTPGGPAITMLGLTYGRAPGFHWDIAPAPKNFGQGTGPTNELTQTITAANWYTTVYTPKDPQQPALPFAPTPDHNHNPLPPVPVTTPPITNGPGDTLLANNAQSVAGGLGKYGGYFCDAGPYFPTAPTANPLGYFCGYKNGMTLDNGDGYATCVLFVRYCLQISSHKTDPYGNGNQTGNLTAQGFSNVTFLQPQPGDIPYWDYVGAPTGAGQSPDATNGAGHVAIIVGVLQPDATGKGSVTVAQANCTQTLQSFPLYQRGSQWIIGSNTGFGPWLGLIRVPSS